MEELGYYSDQAQPDVRVACALAEAEYERRAANSHTAAQMVAIHSVLDEARLSPEVYVTLIGPPTRQDVEFAERAAVADLAVRLALSETTVRSYESQAVTMMARTPLAWDRFRWGEISPANARVIAELAASLPDDPSVFAAFDAGISEDASRLAPARFRTRARSVREKLVADSAAERHESERSQRRVLVQPDLDGMSWFSAYLPAEDAARADARLDAEAASLSAVPGETRTLAQLRADILSRWITGADSDAPVGVRVGVLVPMMTLLGLSERPATLEGYGPIDADTARDLCGESDRFFRILTDPVTGAIVDIDRPTRHIPAGIRRMRQLIDQTCVFPGCGKRAANCDLDHTVDLQFGGTTRLTNLAHLCRNHHRDKHQTKWAVTQSDDGRIQWTSPTGHVADPDPPPLMASDWSNPELDVHHVIAAWAAECAERVLPLFENENSGDHRPRDAIEALRAWARGELAMPACRVAAFAAHAAARETTSPVAVAAARAAGQACSVPHMFNHAPHAANYAVRAVTLALGKEAGDAEREWQRTSLTGDARAALGLSS